MASPVRVGVEVWVLGRLSLCRVEGCAGVEGRGLVEEEGLWGLGGYRVSFLGLI